MSKITAVLFILIFFSCKQNTQTTVKQDTSVSEAKITVKDSFDITADTVIVAGQKLIAIFKYDFIDCENEFKVINKFGDIAYSRYDCIQDYEFVDFNEDGYNDILFNYITNVPDINNLAIFSSDSTCFIDVVGFNSYPSSQKIKGAAFYYSYSRDGCADFNWMSDLYYIKNYEIFPIGHIKGLGCERNEDTVGIYIYKTKDSSETLIKTYPIDTITKLDGYKWEFIEKYWKENYRKFVN
jgi:hypothetical protein